MCLCCGAKYLLCPNHGSANKLQKVWVHVPGRATKQARKWNMANTMFWQISCLAFDQPFILDLNINHLKTNSTQKEACNLLKATKSYVFSRTPPFTKPNSPCLVTFAISNEITRFLLHLLCHWALKTGAKYLSSTICCSEDKSKFSSQNSVRWVQKRSQNTHNRMWQRWEYLHKYNMWSNEFWQVL